MKIKHLLTKTLLVAVGLLLGQSVWAVDIVETYDFAAFITANGTANLTTSGAGIAQSGTSEKVGTVKVINNLTANAQTLNLKGRFAVDYQYDAGVQIRFIWRSNSGTNYQHGLAGQWNNKGAADAQGAARFSVLNLKAGDKITFTYYKQAGKAADPYTCSASQLTGIAADAALASGTKYTVAADGNLDLYFTNNNFAIASIVIETTGTETVSTPTFAMTGAYNNTRKVTITAGTSDAGNDITTYYTTDGSDPSTTSPNSFTTASQEITIGEGILSENTVTVKAISVSSASTESTVGSQDYTVGTTIKLAKPEITLTGMGLDNEKYYKQYSFDAVTTGTYGSPTITLNATLGGNPISSPYTASTAGTISVTASADGYTTSDATTLVVDAAAFLLARSYDFTQDSYRDGLSIEGNNITILGTGVNVYRITTVDFIDGLTLSTVSGPTTNFGITKAQNYNNCKGLTPRWGSGTITINNWIDGSFATITDYVGNGVYATSSDGTFSFGGQINNNTFTALNIYTPAEAKLSTTITSAGWSTLYTPYALDFSTLSSEIEAYTATLGVSTVTLNKVDNVPANTGVVLKKIGGTGSYDIPVIASSSTPQGDLTGNASADTPYDAGTNRYYLALNGESKAQFKKLTSGSIAAGKAFLETAVAAPVLNVVFGDDNMTGIADVRSKMEDVRSNIFDLQGRKVAQPQKGLYIVNGKKVVIK